MNYGQETFRGQIYYGFETEASGNLWQLLSAGTFIVALDLMPLTFSNYLVKSCHQSSFLLRRLVGFLSRISLEAYACADRMFVSRQKLAFTVYRRYDEYMKLEKTKVLIISNK